MAFLSSLDGPQVGAVRVLALVPGATASAVPRVAPAAAISIAPDQAPLPQFSGRSDHRDRQPGMWSRLGAA
jgi:hypothetical protein